MVVNTEMVHSITAALDANDANAFVNCLVDPSGLSLASIAHQFWTWIRTNRDPHEQNLDTACKIEHLIRNGEHLDYEGLKAAYKRFVTTKIHRCTNCDWIGHNDRTCPN
jgi:hypothetical protein